MLPIRGHQLAKSLKQSLKHGVRNYGAAATVPLTDALEETVASRTPRKTVGDVRITKLENGIKVASLDNGGAVSRLFISFTAGSRYEANSLQGITHIINKAAFITNNERSSLRTVREVQQTGGSLESANTRELLSRNAVFIRTKLFETLENIAPGITSPTFNKWDLQDVLEHCHGEITTLEGNGTAVNLELLHKAAYRSGLGNSLYCDPLRIGSFSPEQLEEFASNNYVGEKMTVVGSDVDHDELIRYVREMFNRLPRGQSADASQQKYHGGEVHKHTANGLTYASLVSEGAGLFQKDLAALTVLQKILGCGQYMKWGSNTVSSRLNKAAQSLSDGPLMVNALNVSYSDSGLFGFHAIAEPQTISSVLKAAVGQMAAVAKGDVTAEDVERAKNQSKASILMLTETQESNLEDVLNQVAFTGTYTPATEAVKNIEQVTKDNIVQIAKKIYSGKPTLAVNGDTTCAPYVDELF